MGKTGVTFEHKKTDTSSGRLRTPVTFYRFEPDSGPEPGESEKETLHKCLCEAYNPSMKDLAVMDSTGTKEGLTVRIRDTGGEYIPSNQHFATLEDYRYNGKVFSVVDVRNDLTDNRFVVILLGVVS